ncbi:MAG: carboxy terminal-processing peptidase [Deltaproteobacteria bacterium]|nr:carboxy terminal-processing peptidase [Deltaproteobacteria bacterium]
MPATRTFLIVLSLLFSLVSASSYGASPGTPKLGYLDCPVIPPIMQGFLSHHVGFRKLDPELETRTIEQFLNRLDPSKTYLLESDVSLIRGNLKGIFKKVGQDCSALQAAHQVLVKRVEETVAYVKQVLGGHFKLDKNTQLEAQSQTRWIPDSPADFQEFVQDTELLINPKMRTWPSTTKDQRDLTMKLIQFQISNYLATDMKLAQAKKQLEHRYELNVKRQKELSRDDLYGFFLDAFATSLDAHSGFLSRDTLEDFEISMRLSLEGIGAALTWEDGYTTVDNLIPGGAAEKSGEVQPKDKIIAVAQADGTFENVIDMPLRDVVRLIRGKKGTMVRLTILRQSGKETERRVVSLKRDKISLQDEAAKLTYTTVKEGGKNLKIAVIDLPSFYGDMTRQTRSCYDDMKKLVGQAAREKADGMILDLSRNGGGLLSEAVRIGGLFVKRGNIVATQDSQQKSDMLADDNEDIAWNGPLAILTSRLSASASEIVSGALKDYRRALIVGGDHTFGKGTVQAMMNLPRELGAIKVTTGMFFVPSGNSTQYAGVPADIELPSVFSTKDIGEKSLDYSLPPKTIPAFLSSEVNDGSPARHWNPVTSALVEKLRALSSARAEKDPEFKKIRTELAEIEKNKGIIRLADSMKKMKEEKAKEKKKEKKLGKRRGRRESDEEYLKLPQVHEAVQIMADMVGLSRSGTSQAAATAAAPAATVR